MKEEARKADWNGLQKCLIDHQVFIDVEDSQIRESFKYNTHGRIELSFPNTGSFKVLRH